MTQNHPWVSKSGRRWSLWVKSDMCRDCGTTPDDHPPDQSEPASHDEHPLTQERLARAIKAFYKPGPPEGFRWRPGERESFDSWNNAISSVEKNLIDYLEKDEQRHPYPVKIGGL